jgi:hypothetical protein
MAGLSKDEWMVGGAALRDRNWLIALRTCCRRNGMQYVNDYDYVYKPLHVLGELVEVLKECCGTPSPLTIIFAC